MNINVNDVNIFYEEYGKGQPIILLHGNSETHEIFDKLIEQLKENYKVYAIDSRCHGKSENTNEISYDLMSDDIISFIKVLKIEKPILYGFSDGINSFSNEKGLTFVEYKCLINSLIKSLNNKKQIIGKIKKIYLIEF